MTQQLSWIPNSPTLEEITWKLYIDGASRGNPGSAGVGIYIMRGDEAFIKEGFFIGSCTNNQAEYTALLLGLCRLRIAGVRDSVHIFSDSELLVRQVKRVYRVHHVVLQRLHKRAHELLEGINYQIQHIPREHNTIADALANEGIDKLRPVAEELQRACRITSEGLPCD
jgi:ribonuclease HI